MAFYSYLWLRKDGTPYYAGKGSGNRAYRRHAHNQGLQPPSDSSLILVFPMANEAEAFESEIALIYLFGRKDLGTGCLVNHTNGGENPPSAKGRKRSESFIQKMRERKPTIQTLESREKNRQAHIGRKHTKASKEKQSASLKKTLSHPDIRKKYQHYGETNHFFGRRHTTETKAKISATKTGVSHQS
jgi:hypothetical protein